VLGDAFENLSKSLGWWLVFCFRLILLEEGKIRHQICFDLLMYQYYNVSVFEMSDPG
jgi:hypothetical protein